jgi:hypothetical protein
VLIGTLIAGSIRFDAGLFSAAAGLLALSIAGGSIRGLMLTAGSPALFMALAIETLLLGAILLAGWQLQWILHRNEWLKPDGIRDGVLDVPQPIVQKLLSLGVQVVVMTVAMLLLAQSDRQAQVIVAVGLSAFLGTLASYYVGPVQPSVWFWMGPIIVGTIGYVLTYANPGGWEIADPRGYFAALVRPLPLDYAGAGTLGALMGYWLSRRWQANAEAAQRDHAVKSPAT